MTDPLWHTLILSAGMPDDKFTGVLKHISLFNVLSAIAIILAAYGLASLGNAVFETWSARAPRARFFFKLLATIIRFSLWLLATLSILSLFTPTRETLLAVVASVGIALGLGAQDLVKNIIGGLVILLDRPYQEGDRVRIGDAYGEIKKIGLHSTRLVTPDDTQVTIPNNAVLSGMAWNANSGVPDCQVVTDLYLPHHADAAEAIAICQEAALSSPYLLLTKPVVVHIRDGFADQPYTLYRVKAYVYDHRYENRLMTDITVRAKAEFRRRGLLWENGGHVPPPPAELLSLERTSSEDKPARPRRSKDKTQSDRAATNKN